MMNKIFKSIIVAILTWESALVLRRYKPFIVAVTGSVGKTSTKDAIYHVLKDTTNVRKNKKSFNSELGVPLTVLGLDNAWHSPLSWFVNLVRGFFLIIVPWRSYPHLLVLEIGADHPGDIKNIAKWMRPDIAVVTRLPDRPVHVAYFASPEDVRKEKAELVLALRNRGVFVANADDRAVFDLRTLTKARTVTYGFSEGAQIRGSYPKVRYEKRGAIQKPVGISFHVDVDGNSFPVMIDDVVGMQPCFSSLAALAVGFVRGESMLRMTESLRNFKTPRGRMRIIDGKNNSTIIDDSYNSSPVAAEAALETLKGLEGKRKIVFLGDMLELGQFEEEEHHRIGRIAGGIADMLITVGKRAEMIAQAAKDAGLSEDRIRSFINSQEAGEWFAKEVAEDDIILVKGSQGSGENMIRMERTVKELMEHPEKSSKLLVRQEKEWLKQYVKK